MTTSRCASLVLAGLLAACAPGDNETASETAEVTAAEPTLDEIRAATARYQDVNVALAEGYIADPSGMCETAANLGQPAGAGAMGIHYFRPDLLQITAQAPRLNGTGVHTDFLQPAVLLYEPQADGSLELLGVENVVFAEAWRAAGNQSPPTFHGESFDHMMDDPATPIDEAHMFEEHYDRHVWIFRENPSGVFAQYNPNATCEHHTAPPPQAM